MSHDDPRHGKISGYRAGCRRACCRRAISRYNEARKLARLQGQHTGFVPANGTRLRLQALQALGWSSVQLGARSGWDPAWIRHLASAAKLVRRETAQRVTDLYDEISMTLPPAGVYSTRTANRARALGWLPPLALDDDRLDDPTYEPRMRTTGLHVTYDHAVVERVLGGDPKPRRLRKAESEEIVRRSYARGLSGQQITALYGIKAERHNEPEEAC